MVTARAGVFTVDVGSTREGELAWLRVHDYPQSNAAASAGLDPGWAYTDGYVEFRLRRRDPDLTDHVAQIPVALGGLGELFLGWQEDPFPRVGAIALTGHFANEEILPAQ